MSDLWYLQLCTCRGCLSSQAYQSMHSHVPVTNNERNGISAIFCSFDDIAVLVDSQVSLGVYSDNEVFFRRDDHGGAIVEFQRHH